jgi:hypothetical protein
MFAFRAASMLLLCLCCLNAGCQAPYKVTSLFGSEGLFSQGFFSRQRPAEAVAQVQQQTISTPTPIVLATGMELQWRVRTAQEQPGQVRSGSGMIGPDGTVEVGPYGTCKVSGMTLDQAALAIEQHLAAYIQTPSVQLSATSPASQTALAWRSARTGGQGTVARSGATTPGTTVLNETVIEPAGLRR